MGQLAISRLQNMDCVGGGNGHAHPHAHPHGHPSSPELTLSDEKIARKIMPASTTTTLALVPSNGLQKRVTNGVTKLKSHPAPPLNASHLPAPTPGLEPSALRISNRTSPTKLKRILVTGGAGYIGSHTVLSLALTRRFKVVSIDNYHNSFPLALSRIEDIAAAALPPDPSPDDIDSTTIDAWTADLTREDQVRAVFAHYGPGAFWGVVHIAAYKAVGESNDIPLTYYQVNTGATMTLAELMQEFGCTRLVYSSSATVYGVPPVVPIPETTKLDAKSPYGRSKVMTETILNDYCRANPSTWKCISLRYFNPAGAHPSGLIGEEPKGRPGNLLPLLAHMAIGRVKDSTLKVFGNDYPTHDGTCVRDYLHVIDLANGHRLALDALDESTELSERVFRSALEAGDGHYKAYNLGRGRGQSVYDIVEAMRKATGYDFKTEVTSRRPGDVPDLTADPTLAEQELGFKARRDLETMCRDLWNWQTKNPHGYQTVRPSLLPSKAKL